MNIIITAFLRALGQFSDPTFQRILWVSIATSVALLWTFAIGLSWGVAMVLADGIRLPWIGTVFTDPLSIGWSSFIIAIGLSVFLMVPIASFISSLFVDRVARAVEKRHYPNIPAPKSQKIGDALRDTVMFLGIIILANAVAFILYVMMPPIAPFVFWALNGYLLGREYFQMAAARHVGRDGAKSLWSNHKIKLWVAGILMVAPLSIPILNLIVPVLAAATFTHLFHQIPKKPYDDKGLYR